MKSDEIESLGGLILVKFAPENPAELPEIDIKVSLEYEDLGGHKFSK